VTSGHNHQVAASGAARSAFANDSAKPGTYIIFYKIVYQVYYILSRPWRNDKTENFQLYQRKKSNQSSIQFTSWNCLFSKWCIILYILLRSDSHYFFFRKKIV
jgi:hypothetical protein